MEPVRHGFYGVANSVFWPLNDNTTAITCRQITTITEEKTGNYPSPRTSLESNQMNINASTTIITGTNNMVKILNITLENSGASCKSNSPLRTAFKINQIENDGATTTTVK